MGNQQSGSGGNLKDGSNIVKELQSCEWTPPRAKPLRTIDVTALPASKTGQTGIRYWGFTGAAEAMSDSKLEFAAGEMAVGLKFPGFIPAAGPGAVSTGGRSIQLLCRVLISTDDDVYEAIIPRSLVPEMSLTAAAIRNRLQPNTTLSTAAAANGVTAILKSGGGGGGGGSTSIPVLYAVHRLRFMPTNGHGRARVLPAARDVIVLSMGSDGSEATDSSKPTAHGDAVVLFHIRYADWTGNAFVL